MILRSLRLHPFAGTADRSLPFAEGLNVVVGPNEAGKSTLVRALMAALFRSTRLTPARFKNELGPYLPLGGGDTIRVALAFHHGGEEFDLAKQWSPGSGAAVRLRGPSGELTDHDAVDARMRELAVFSEGTYENVLVTRQAELALTMDRLREEAAGGTMGLADMLRRAAYPLDGVSVDMFRTAVDARVREWDGRWDVVAQRPEKGREVDNPWSKDAGVITKAYYAMRRAEAAHAEADARERALDEVNQQLQKAEGAFQELEAFLGARSAAYADARKRAEVEAVLRAVRAELPAMREAMEQWGAGETTLGQLGPEVDRLRAQYKELQAEKKRTEEFSALVAVRTKYQEVCVHRDRVVEEEQRLKSMKQVAASEVDALRLLEQEVQALRIKVASGQLAVRIHATTPLGVQVKSAEGAREVILEAGKDFSATVRGHATITHSDWEVGVRPAGDDVAAVERSLTERERALQKRSAALGVASADEAALLQRTWQEQHAVVDRHKASLLAALGRDTVEGLRDKVVAGETLMPGRPVDVLEAEMKRVTEEGQRRADEQKRLTAACASWKTRFGSREQLFDIARRKGNEEEEARRTLEGLTPLPAGENDAAAFVKAYEDAERRRGGWKEQAAGLREQRAALQARLPEQSREELRETWDAAKAHFSRAMAEGAAYRKIRHELAVILDALDASTYAPLEASLKSVVRRLTGERYTDLSFDEGVPNAVRSGATTTPRAFLSQGTLDALALAVRLSMAELYLQEERGFIILDDPLVHLDPVRQASAAAVLREIASTLQVVVLTCHPSHADLLGGTRCSL